MKPSEQTPFVVAAWSEVGVIFIGVSGRVTSELYDTIDTRL